MSNVKHWTKRVFYSFDIESTSADPLSAHAVTATIVKLDNGVFADKRAWAMKPAVPIPDEAIEIHKITNEWIQEWGTDAKEALEEIIGMLASILSKGYPLVVFNAAYDLTMLEMQAKYYGLKPLSARLTAEAWHCVIDPFVLAKGYEHYWKQEFVKGRNFKLPSLCERYGVAFEETHDATADALGAGLLAIELVNSDSGLASKGPHALDRLQKQWRVKMQRSLRKYFDEKEIEHDGVDDGWPLHSSVAL